MQVHAPFIKQSGQSAIPKLGARRRRGRTPPAAGRGAAGAGFRRPRLAGFAAVPQPARRAASTTLRMASSWRSKESTILNWTRARSALWPGRCTLK